MSDPRLSAALHATVLFRSLPEDELEWLVSRARVRQVRRGQLLFQTGDSGDSLIVLVSGRIKVVVRAADGGELTLTIVEPGEVLGELSVADGGVRSADAETLDDCTLLVIGADVVRAACVRNPSAGAALTSCLAASLRRLTDAAHDLVLLDLPRRVAKFVLDAPRDSAGTVRLGLTQGELARMVGGTRQSVNAALRGFERRGWLTLVDQSVQLHEPQALERFAGS